MFDHHGNNWGLSLAAHEHARLAAKHLTCEPDNSNANDYSVSVAQHGQFLMTHPITIQDKLWPVEMMSGPLAFYFDLTNGTGYI